MAHEAEENCVFCRRFSPAGMLAADLVWEFPQSIVVLGSWQFFEGYCIAVSRHHVRELYELETAVRHAFVDEVARLAHALAKTFEPRKLNVEMLGNQVPHLHCHLFPRYRRDPDHLKPVWVALDRAEQDPVERRRLETGTVGRDELRERIRTELKHLTS